MDRLRRTPLILGVVAGVTVLTIVTAPVGTSPTEHVTPPESPETEAADAAVLAYFAATAPLWNSETDATKPSKSQVALPHADGTDEAIAATNRFIADVKDTMAISRTTVTTEIVKTTVAGPHRVTTISNVTTDWTLRDEPADEADASATIGHETTIVDTPAGAAVVSDIVLPDS